MPRAASVSACGPEPDANRNPWQVVVTRTRFELFSGSPTLIGLTIASVAGIAWFAWHQWRHPAPLMRLSVLRESSFQAGLALYIVFYYLSTGMSLLLPRLMEGGAEDGVSRHIHRAFDPFC